MKKIFGTFATMVVCAQIVGCGAAVQSDVNKEVSSEQKSALEAFLASGELKDQSLVNLALCENQGKWSVSQASKSEEFVDCMAITCTNDFGVEPHKPMDMQSGAASASLRAAKENPWTCRFENVDEPIVIGEPDLPIDPIMCTEVLRVAVQVTVLDNTGMLLSNALVTVEDEKGNVHMLEQIEAEKSVFSIFGIEGKLTLSASLPGYDIHQEKIEVIRKGCELDAIVKTIKLQKSTYTNR